MATISKDLVKTLAFLARIPLDDAQIEKYALDLGSVVGYMEEIKNIDVKDISETSRVSDEENVLREDVVGLSLSQDDALKNTKDKHDGYFLVPIILKQD